MLQFMHQIKMEQPPFLQPTPVSIMPHNNPFEEKLKDRQKHEVVRHKLPDYSTAVFQQQQQQA